MTTVPGPNLPPGTVVEDCFDFGTKWRFWDRRIEGVTFRGIRDGVMWMSFRRVVFVDCAFEDCDLSWAWGGCHERQDDASHLLGCRIVGCDMSHFSFAYGRIEGCTFERCWWETRLHTVDLVDNVFVGVVESLTIWGRHVPVVATVGPRLRPNEIRGNDFRGADLRGLGLYAEVPVRDQLWPEGPNCAIVDRIPERVALILERTAGAEDPIERALNERARWWAVMNDDDPLQSVAWLRWDDPSMPDTWNRFNRALAEIDLE